MPRRGKVQATGLAMLLEHAVADGLVVEAKYSAQQMKDMMAKGHAVANDNGDPSYPIGDEADLKNAIRAVGRGKGSHDKIRAHIVKRAKALGKSDLIPDNWTSSGAKESAAPATDSHTATITEAGRALVEAPGSTSGRLNIQIITPGWGSSGYYSAEVLESAATYVAFPKGTKMWLDHPTEAEAAERPSRSVKDIAAVLLEDATWNGSALVAPAHVVAPYQPLFSDKEFRESIGVSIRASAEVSEGEADGRRGVIVDRIVEGKSVDFVAAAGRGGRVLELIESAREVAEASANDTRDSLQKAIATAYNDDNHGTDKPSTWSWVRDYDPDAKVVYFDVSTDGKNATYQQSYESDAAGVASLTGERIEVVAQTRYTAVATESAAEVVEARNIGQWIESRLHLNLTQLADDMFGDGRLTREERIALSSAVGDGLTAFTKKLEGAAPALYERDLWTGPETAAASEAAAESQASSPAGEPAPEPDPAADDPAATGDEPTTTDPAAPAAAAPADAAESITTPEVDMSEDQGAGGTAAPLTSVRQIIDAELAESRKELATVRARENARRILGEALRDQWVPPATVTRITEHLMHDLPLTAANVLDEAELIKRATRELGLAEQELTEALQAAGMGRPRDLGYSSDSQIGGLAAPELDRRLEEAFTGLGLNESTAKIAAKGRG